MYTGYLRTGEVAARLGFSAVTIRKWADKGFLPHVTTPSGERRFAEYVVQDFEKQLQGEKEYELPWLSN